MRFSPVVNSQIPLAPRPMVQVDGDGRTESEDEYFSAMEEEEEGDDKPQDKVTGDKEKRNPEVADLRKGVSKDAKRKPKSTRMITIDQGPGKRKVHVQEEALIAVICRRNQVRDEEEAEKIRLKFCKDIDEGKLDVDDLMELYCGHMEYALTVKPSRKWLEEVNPPGTFIKGPSCNCEAKSGDNNEDDKGKEEPGIANKHKLCPHVKEHLIIELTNATIRCGPALEVDLKIETQLMFQDAVEGKPRRKYTDPLIEMLALVGIMEEIEKVEDEQKRQLVLDDSGMEVSEVETESESE